MTRCRREEARREEKCGRMEKDIVAPRSHHTPHTSPHGAARPHIFLPLSFYLAITCEVDQAEAVRAKCCLGL